MAAAAGTDNDIVDNDDRNIVDNDAMDNDYVAGLIDAQLKISVTKYGIVRALLVCNDARVPDEVTAAFPPTRVTIVKRPGKKDVCTCLFLGDNASELLEFAARHCVLKKRLAESALAVIAGTATTDDLATDIPEDIDLSLEWAAGFFDVRGTIVPATTTPKKRRASASIAVPKAEKSVIPAIHKVMAGKIRASSPCRLVFDTKESIRAFVELVEDHIRVKKLELDQL